MSDVKKVWLSMTKNSRNFQMLKGVLYPLLFGMEVDHII